VKSRPTGGFPRAVNAKNKRREKPGLCERGRHGRRLANASYRRGFVRAAYLAFGEIERLRRMMEIALASGGCVKVDVKAADENLHAALTGASNRQTWENLARLAEYVPRRPSPPPLVASTLLVPGYVDEDEVGVIASRLAALNDDIPYSLLAFYPSHQMRDLPTTSRAHAERCYRAARGAGLKRVRLANVHLLGPGDYA